MYRIICLISIFATFFQYENATEIVIEQGTLLGAAFSSRSGRQFHAFLGIPFAKPPVDHLRFQPPQLPEPWNGARNFTELPSICIQNVGMGFMGEEDCLYLNVYTPAEKPKTSLLPVMVYIHGGGFIFGGSVFHNPKYFMDYDIIVVTIAYRLNVLGFLSTGDDVVPGNNGMKDQVMALKWVQKNIAAFGGNPDQVTIFGNSAGAVSVHYHSYSPLSKGLFHRGILQSGSALAIWSHARSTLIRERVRTLGTLLFCPTENSQKLVDCLRKISAEELILAHNKLSVWGFEPGVLFPLVSEPSTVKDAFIHESPWYQHEINTVPWIVGMVSNEGLMLVAGYLKDDAEKISYLSEHYKRLWPMNMHFTNRIELGERTDQIVESIKNFYFSNKNISAETWMELCNLKDVYKSVCGQQLCSDVYFVPNIIESTKRHMDTKYVYYYDHRNVMSFSDIFGDPGINRGVCHEDELLSLFYINGLFPEVTEGDDLKVSKRVLNYWVNFATTGNPDPNGVWNPTKSDAIEYLHITAHKDEMKVGLLQDRYHFWKNLNIAPMKEGEV